MPEQPDLTPDPLAETLRRFTPDAAGLDRDTVIFLAGRRSARPNRPWQALAGVLAACQVLTLGLWLTGTDRPGPAPARAPMAAATPAEPPAPPPPSSPYSYAALRRGLVISGTLPWPEPQPVDFVGGPVLTVHSDLSAAGWD